jgi:hypothetical protein
VHAELAQNFALLVEAYARHFSTYYSIRILIVDAVHFLRNVLPFVLFKIFLEYIYIITENEI